MIRFVRADRSVRIDCGEGDWIEIREELSVDDARALAEAVATGGAMDRYREEVLAYLLAWSAVDESGRPVPVETDTDKRDAVRNLATEELMFFRARIHEHQARYAEKNSRRWPIPTGDRAPAKGKRTTAAADGAGSADPISRSAG